MHMLEVMVVKAEARLRWFGAVDYLLSLRLFYEFTCGTDFLPLMETLITLDNTDVGLHLQVRKKDKTIINTGRKKRHARRVRKDRENSTEGQLINCPL